MIDEFVLKNRLLERFVQMGIWTLPDWRRILLPPPSS